MCGRYITEEDESVDMKELYNVIRGSNPGIFLKSGEIFPTDTVPILCNREYTPTPGTWGFESFKNKGVLINARAESVTEKPTFAKCFLNNRCIVPTNGYYEWSRSKVKYRFNIPNSNMVYLAGIFRYSSDGIRFVILTTSANDSVYSIHHRMPLILNSNSAEAWMHSAKDASDCLHMQMPSLEYTQV